MPTPGVLQTVDPHPQPQPEVQVAPVPEPAPEPVVPALASQSRQLIEEFRTWPVPSIEQIIRDWYPPEQQQSWFTPQDFTYDSTPLINFQLTNGSNIRPYFVATTNSSNSLVLQAYTYENGTGSLTYQYQYQLPLYFSDLSTAQAPVPHGSAYERQADRHFAHALSLQEQHVRDTMAEIRADCDRIRQQMGQERGAAHIDVAAATARVRERAQARDPLHTTEVERAWQEDQARQREERKRAREAAHARARELLLEHLADDQITSFLHEEQFLVVTRSGRRYRIRSGYAGNVEELREDGVPIARYCIHPTLDVPVPDVLLSQLLLLQADERTFRQIANRTALRIA